jgi:hypothetical protein
MKFYAEITLRGGVGVSRSHSNMLVDLCVCLWIEKRRELEELGINKPGRGRGLSALPSKVPDMHAGGNPCSFQPTNQHQER